MYRVPTLIAAVALLALSAQADAKDKLAKVPKLGKTHCVDATTGKKAICGTANAVPSEKPTAVKLKG